MKTPHLNRKLVLEDAYHAPDGAGGHTTTWQALGTLWAQIRPGSGRSRSDDGLSRSIVPLKITVRAAPAQSASRPHAGQRFREGARIYRIIAVADADSAARYLVCHAEEEVVA